MPTKHFDGFSIDQFRSNFEKYGGARPYLFYVIPSFPMSVGRDLEDMPIYLVRSSSIPGKEIEAVEVSWQGSKYPFGGKTTFSDWTVTFTVDAKAKLYNAFLDWSDLIHDPATNKHGNPRDYMVDQVIQLLSPDGAEAILSMKLIGAWVKTVANLDLAYDGSDVATFDVTYGYVRHERER
jgi:hypothetical protein